MNEQLAAHDITYRQWVLLAYLSLLGREASQSELAERMGIEACTLVGVIDPMERDGWIQRVPDPSDRRKKLIRSTERVEPVWMKMAQCALQVRGKAAGRLAPEQLDQPFFLHVVGNPPVEFKGPRKKTTLGHGGGDHPRGREVFHQGSV